MGVCLLIVHRVFKGTVPSLRAYAESEELSEDTIRRAARMLRFPVMRLLRARRPGPRRATSREQAPSQALAACRAALAIVKALLPGPVASLLATPAQRGLAVQHALHFKREGIPLHESASSLGIDVRTLRRWVAKFQQDGGLQVQHGNRRPKSSPGQVPLEIQDALFRLRLAFPDLSVAELSRIFNQRFAKLLDEHGWKTLTAKTAGRYLRGERPKPPPAPEGSRRGEYQYPPPLTMAWVDTTPFTVAGNVVHIVGAMEASSRIGLSADVFAEENTNATAEILALSLSRIPDLSAVVRDHGTPYLNGRINGLLASFSVLPINAFPHFPIDKAALERWWGTMKAWLRHALIPFEGTCRKEGRIPSKDEVVTVVRPALRLFLRAYNLLPQDCIDGKSPIERIDALLRGEGEPGFTLSDLRRAAVERETKDDLLVEIRDALQMNLSIEKLRSDFAHVSKTALRRAVTATARPLVLERDLRIRHPYRYLLAVAKIKEREWQEEEARTRRHEHEARRRAEENARQAERLRIEEEKQRLSPEERLACDLDSWIRCFRHPLATMGRWTATRLRATLQSLRTKLGDAFSAQLTAIQERLPGLLEQLRPQDLHLKDKLVAEFAGLASPSAPRSQATKPATPGSASGPPPPAPSSSRPFQHLVRKVLDDLLTPHVHRTDVPP